jgi:hypothetical protein
MTTSIVSFNSRAEGHAMPWSLDNLWISEESLITSPRQFGHNLKVTFLLRYTPVPNNPYVETPFLRWKEKIVMLDHTSRQRWDATRDQARYAPDSATLIAWIRRYIMGHTADHFRKGSVSLLDNQRHLVQFIVRGEIDDAAKAESVRNYLDTYGGYLQIELHDIPSLGIPLQGTVFDRERLLLIDCGIAGRPRGIFWSQHLRMSSAVPQQQWQRQSWRSWPLVDLPTPPGFSLVLAPTGPSTYGPRPGSGEIL